MLYCCIEVEAILKTFCVMYYYPDFNVFLMKEYCVEFYSKIYSHRFMVITSNVGNMTFGEL